MTLLTLLGEQPIPNLLPLWQHADFDRVRFVATERTRPLADALQAFIHSDPQLQSLTVLPPLMVPPYDLPAARSMLAQAIGAAVQDGHKLTINLTGGTKLMSLAAMQAAYGQAVPLLYVSTETNSLIFYTSDGVESHREEIRVRVTVEQYLRAHGIEVGEDQNFNPKGPFSDIRPTQAGDELEQAVFAAAGGLGKFDDVRRGVYIRRKGRDDAVVNELDICVTYNGRLAVCSCKSGKYLSNDDLYELESLSRRERFGIYCGRVFVSAQDDLPKSLKERAAADNIRLAFGGAAAQRAVEQIAAAVGLPPKDKP